MDGAGAGRGGAGGALLLRKWWKARTLASSLPYTLVESETLCLAAMKISVQLRVPFRRQAPSNSSQSTGALLFTPG